MVSNGMSYFNSGHRVSCARMLISNFFGLRDSLLELLHADPDDCYYEFRVAGNNDLILGVEFGMHHVELFDFNGDLARCYNV